MTREELRAAILDADDCPIAPVPTPEWPAVDGLVHVRTLSGIQRDRYFRAIRRDVADVAGAPDTVVKDVAQFHLAAAAMCDAAGAVLFTEADVVQLGEKSSLALARVIDAASDLNGLSAKAAEDAKKNFAPETATSALSTA